MTDFEKLVYELRLAQNESSVKRNKESLERVQSMEKKVDMYLNGILKCLKY